MAKWEWWFLILIAAAAIGVVILCKHLLVETVNMINARGGQEQTERVCK
jgi:uncharacterized protein YpmS